MTGKLVVIPCTIVQGCVMRRRWKGGDLVLVWMPDLDGGGEWAPGRVLRAPHEQREGVAVTVDCDDGWRRYVEPARLRPALTMIDGGAPLYQREAAAAAVSGRSVACAAVVLDRGAPELVEATRGGAIAVSAAADLTDLPLAEQSEVLARPTRRARRGARQDVGYGRRQRR